METLQIDISQVITGRQGQAIRVPKVGTDGEFVIRRDDAGNEAYVYEDLTLGRLILDLCDVNSNYAAQARGKIGFLAYAAMQTGSLLTIKRDAADVLRGSLQFCNVPIAAAILGTILDEGFPEES